jgi:hypothetical protein
MIPLGQQIAPDAKESLPGVSVTSHTIAFISNDVTRDPLWIQDNI